MLNYNYNIIEPSNQPKKASANKPTIFWDFSEQTVTISQSMLTPIAHATMSILASASNALSASDTSGGSFITSPESPVSASLTGAGTWPTTGSVTMSLYVAGLSSFGRPPFYYNPTYYASAVSGNLNQSGSILRVNFDSNTTYDWYISGSIIARKGNEYNPLVNLIVKNESPVSNTVAINGYTASFNMVKDTNVPLYSFLNVTGSTSKQFQYQYNFGITSSFTASINNVTGSTTMSFSIPQAGVSASQTFFNPSTTTARLTASFAATNDNPYNVTASVIFNKGNISNSTINVYQSGSTYDSGALFKVVKDANVDIISLKPIYSASTFTYTNDYAFNQTASISGSYNWPESSSFQALTMSLNVPEIGYFITASHTASFITASFAAQTNINPYTISASIELEPYPPYFLEEYIIIGGGGAGGTAQAQNQGAGGGGAGAIVSGSQAIVYANSIYTVTVGDNGISGSGGGDSSFVTGSIISLRAPGGGYGGSTIEHGGGTGGDGGCPGGGLGTAAGNVIPATGSGIYTIFQNAAGNGGSGVSGPPSAQPYSVGGGGGGANGPGTSATTNGCATAGGGAGSGINSGSFLWLANATASGFPSGSLTLSAGGSPTNSPSICGNEFGSLGANTTIWGCGGGGASGGANPNGQRQGGAGGRGVFVIKYLGTQKGRGGLVHYDGTYTYHTFYSSSLYWSTANMTPKMH